MVRKFGSGLLWVSLSLGVFSCGEEPQFTISGTIGGTSGGMVYLENVGVSRVTLLDSAQLKKGTFSLRHHRPDAPDFYRLRFGKQLINLAIDSTETIVVTADSARFARDYTLAGDAAENLKIKELTLLQLEAAQRYHALQKQYDGGAVSLDDYYAGVNALSKDYKTRAQGYIVANFGSTAAYFALFQQIDGQMIFDIYNPHDSKLFGAVANTWNTTCPDAPRTTQLKTWYAQSRAALRPNKTPVEVAETDTKTYFDITLPGTAGQAITLSQTAQGQVKLIDFTAYSMDGSPAHNRQLADLYSKHRTKGLEIYQISLDSDTHFWHNAAANLPWICVHDEQSIYSPTAKKYNVTQIPTMFLINRQGEIAERIDDVQQLAGLLAKYL
ncbi:TlpA disulfide reductase family protein [Candidatus Symbiothrix dinenymphae]|uniref:TlpA disulfide reductase family protein n=1 Tax=Candidatus Symbiothrix dinenymphae TaxID=467085 RepID=UPI0006BFDAEA|nr:TlpA disulfide reductase family protein [Candidatus Symbiothrix dinenymphae]GAP71442.1 hypothetical protein SAMD00024442_12_31 [Candidatus Symbiothrix dinenymphae]